MAKKDNWDVFTLDNLWHFLGGAAIAGLGYGIGLSTGLDWIGFIGVSVAGATGIVREVLQHKGDIFTKHRITEALTWSVGALPFFIALISF